MEAKKDDFGASLRAALAEHPDYPVIVMVSGEAVPDALWCVCTDNARVEVGEYLDCPDKMKPREEWVYMDRSELREDIEEQYPSMLEVTFERAIKEEMDAFEPYWRPCVIIRAY